MKTLRASTVVAVLAAFSAPASAVPIEFDFRGIVNYTVGPRSSDGPQSGAAFAAQLTIDTDRLLAGDPQEDSIFGRIQYFNDLFSGAMAVNGSLDIGGKTVDLHPYANNVGSIYFVDSSGPQPCGPDGATCADLDAFGISVYSSDVRPPGPFTGVLNLSNLNFVAGENSDTIGDYLDLTNGIDVTSIVTLPLETFELSYSRSMATCSGSCRTTQLFSTVFQIDTVTRRIASVPEPDSLALMLAGLAGVAFAGRRIRRRSMRNEFDEVAH